MHLLRPIDGRQSQLKHSDLATGDFGIWALAMRQSILEQAGDASRAGERWDG